MTYDEHSLSGADDARLPVTGAGGGGKGGSSAKTAPDTLFSTATVRLIDLLGEGEIVGVRGGLKGVYLNDVPVQNADGSFNFKGLSAEFRVGTPDQTYMPGYPDVQTPKDVGIKVNRATPVVVSITDTDVDRVRVTIQVPSLFLSKSDGTVSANSLNYRIEARYSGGPWVNALGDQTLTGKTTSGYFRSHEIALPRNPSGASAPWQVQVTRLSDDTDGFNNSQNKLTKQSDLIFYSTTSIVDAKFSYPHSAMVGLTAQASSFGSSVPARTYLADGVLMPIPSNYDPVTRVYTGIWDGTFKEGFTNNPAWALYLILRDDRFGLGEFIDAEAIDKWSLYEIARYCDVLVDDGKGGKEPRYTFNGSISSQQQAFELIQLIAQIFRGSVYWSSGSVMASQDRPGDPVLLVTEANTLDEAGFSYASSGRRARHTVALVAWNDPDNLFKEAIEVVEDAEGVARYGYNPTRIDLLGCTSRGQAHRAGLWTLFTELHQTQVVTYKAGLDHAMARPGDVIAIQDPQIANLDLSGRLGNGSGAAGLVLDRPVNLTLASGYSISVVLPDGKVEERAITNGIGTHTTVSLGTPLSQTPDPAAVWLIAGPIEPQLFRIISIHEEEPHIYAVSALQHEPGKYAAIDSGAAFEPSTITEFPAIVLPPKDLTVRESQYTERGQAKQALTLSWTAGQSFNATAHYVTVVRPSGAIVTSRTPSTSIDFLDAEAGTWKFTVVTTGLNGNASLPVEKIFTVLGWAGLPPATVTDLSVKGGGSAFAGRSCSLAWTNRFADGVPPYPIQNVVCVYDASTAALLRREMLPVGQTEWTYDYNVNVNDGGPRRQFRVTVAATTVDGTEGPSTSLLVSNPAPSAPSFNLRGSTYNFTVDVTPPIDSDLAGTIVVMSKTSPVALTAANARDIGNSYTAQFPGEPGETWYVRAACYDAFDKTLANLAFAAEQTVTLSEQAFDVSAPTIPGKPSLTTNATENSPIGGGVTAWIVATWAASTGSFLDLYEVQFKQGSGEWGGAVRVSGNKIEQHGFLPATAYTMRVRAVSKNNAAVSGWSPETTFTTAKSKVAPANPTGAKVDGGFEKATGSYTPSVSLDLAHIELWGLNSASAAAAPPTGSVLLQRLPASAMGFLDTLPTTGTRTYWLRAVSTSGVTATSYVRVGTAESAQLAKDQLAARAVDKTKLAADMRVTDMVDDSLTAIPAGTQAGQQAYWRGKTYRWNGTTWLAPVDFGSADGTKLTKEQIEQLNLADMAGTLQTRQLTAKSILAQHLSVASMNMAANGDASQGLTGYTPHLDPGHNITAFPLSVEKSSGPDGLDTIAIRCTGTLPAGLRAGIVLRDQTPEGDHVRFAVTPGQLYELSAYLSGTAGCEGYVTLLWLDAAGAYITEHSGTILTLADAPTGGLQTRPRSVVFAPAPVNATAAFIYAFIRKLSGATTNPVLKISGVMMGFATPGQSVASPFVSPGLSTLDGATFRTGTVKARVLDVDEIFANSAVVTKMTVAVLKAGAITAEMAAFGLNTGNLLPNSDLLAGLRNLAPYGAGVGFDLTLRADWCPPSMRAACVRPTPLGAAAAAGNYIEVFHRYYKSDGSMSEHIPVEGGQRYEMSYYASIHRCEARIVFFAYDINGTVIAASDGFAQPFTPGHVGVNQPLTHYPRVGGFWTFPTNCTHIRFGMRMYLNGGADPYLFGFAFMLAKALPNQTTLSVYTPQSSTIIDGSTLATGTVIADDVRAHKITSRHISLEDRLTGANLFIDGANGVIKAINASVDTLDAKKIRLTGAGHTLLNWQNGADSAEFNGGMISANSVRTTSLTIGARGITVNGIEFYYAPGSSGRTNFVRWNPGAIEYLDDNPASGTYGKTIGRDIPAYTGNYIDTTSTTWYIFWSKGHGDLSAVARTHPDWPAWINGADNVVMAVCSPAAGIMPIYGSTQVDGQKIMALTVRAAQIAGEQINAGHLTSQSIEGRHLRIGTGGKNLLANSDFSAYPAGFVIPGLTWGVSAGGISGQLATNQSGPTWEPPGMRSLQFNFTGYPPAGQIADIYWSRINADGSSSRGIPVQGGQRYELSAYTSAHRCQMYAIIVFHDGNGSYLGEVWTTVNNQVASSGPLSNWFRVHAFYDAPASAAYAILTLRTAFTGGPGPYSFWTGLYFGQAHPLQVELSPWSDGAVTTVEGMGIRTGSVDATRLNVAVLSAISGNVGDLTAGVLRSINNKTRFDLTNGRLTISD